MSFEFQFKQFGLNHSKSSMKIGTDAILLGALTEIENSKHILEIGCGCGIISLILAQRCNAKIDAIDIHEQSIKQANDNFSSSPWPNRLSAKLNDARSYCSEEKYDIIISNPPYYTNSLLPSSNTKQISRHDQTLNFSELCHTICNNLLKNGTFWLILPNSVYLTFSKEASKHDLCCKKHIEISDKPNKSASLIVSSWSFKTSNIEFQKIFIKNPDNRYSYTFKKITSDFYLNF